MINTHIQLHEAPLQERIEQLLRPNLKFLTEGSSIPADASLGSLGLDSLASINLLFDLESEFDVTIPDDMLDENTFSSIAHLEALLLKLIGTPAS